MSMAATNPHRYTVTALIITAGGEARTLLGKAPSRRKARRIGYREGAFHFPLLSHSALFELEIRDEQTGERVRAGWAEEEAYHRARALPTVADVGWW